MEPVDDFGLLRRYAHARDEAAFAQIVRRHINLVFSSALRRTRNRQLAEDVTQAVFVILARKSASLSESGGALSGWLLQCVGYASANAIKMETRRRKHERDAPLAPEGAGACSANPTDVLIWQEIAEQLDDAVLKLPGIDRQAVLLRYFEDRPIQEIAARLNLSEGAAKQRLSRAVQKLRERLSRKGAALMSGIDASSLASLLASHAVRAAPAGLSQAAIAVATGSAPTAAVGISIAKGAITMMNWTKAKLVAGMIGVIVIGGAGGIVAVRSATAAEKNPPPAAQPAADKQNKSDVSVASAPPRSKSRTAKTWPTAVGRGPPGARIRSRR